MDWLLKYINDSFDEKLNAVINQYIVDSFDYDDNYIEHNAPTLAIIFMSD